MFTSPLHVDEQKFSTTEIIQNKIAVKQMCFNNSHFLNQWPIPVYHLNVKWLPTN